ncbi:MAG: response regulator [Pirellulales bacterium]
MKICVVDDHPLVLQGISTVLENAGHVIATAKDIPEAATVLRERGPFDLLLLDYHLPSGKGPDLLSDPTLPVPTHVVILSAMTDPDDILYALEQTSAEAYILKIIDLADLALAVEQLPESDSSTHDGRIWDVERRRFVLARDAFPRGSVLTHKEREVLMLLRKGLLDKQIADQLGRSIHTVRVQIRSVKRKRGHTRRGEVEL